MPEVLLSLGSNLEPQRHLAQALAALPALPQAGAAQASALYRCPAVGFDLSLIHISEPTRPY